MNKQEKKVTINLTLQWSIEIEDLNLSENAWQEVRVNGYQGIKSYNKHFDEITEAIINKIDVEDYIEEIEIEIDEDES